jgi:hypothetical protein
MGFARASVVELLVARDVFNSFNSSSMSMSFATDDNPGLVINLYAQNTRRSPLALRRLSAELRLSFSSPRPTSASMNA